MTIRRFQDSDYPMISSWYVGRKMQAPPKVALPDMGFIVDEIAAGFVYIADGKLALLEGFITSPSSEAGIRDKALDLLVATLIESSGCRHICASTANPAIIGRALKNGFSAHSGRTFLLKEL